MTPQFALTITTGYVEGEAVRYELLNGAIIRADDPLAQLSTEELEEISRRATAEMDARMQYLKPAQSPNA